MNYMFNATDSNSGAAVPVYAYRLHGRASNTWAWCTGIQYIEGSGATWVALPKTVVRCSGCSTQSGNPRQRAHFFYLENGSVRCTACTPIRMCEECGFATGDATCQVQHCRACCRFETAGGNRVYECERCNVRTHAYDEPEPCDECGGFSHCCCYGHRYSFRFNSPGRVMMPDKRDLIRPSVPSRSVGCEIELGEIDLDNSAACKHLDEVRQKWGIGLHGDGTAPTGLEFVTRPAMGLKFREMMQEFCDAMEDADCDASSPRCGGHIHVDARDFTWHDMRRMALLWEKIEESMQLIVPANRRNNRYCQRVQTSFVEAIKKAEKYDRRTLPVAMTGREQFNDDFIRRGFVQHSRDNSRLTSMPECADRYRQLNFASFPKHGTIEFRLWSGATAYSTWLNRAALSAQIVRFAMNNGENKIKSLPVDPMASLHEVIGTRKEEAALHPWVDRLVSQHNRVTT